MVKFHRQYEKKTKLIIKKSLNTQRYGDLINTNLIHFPRLFRYVIQEQKKRGVSSQRKKKMKHLQTTEDKRTGGGVSGLLDVTRCQLRTFRGSQRLYLVYCLESTLFNIPEDFNRNQYRHESLQSRGFSCCER